MPQMAFVKDGEITEDFYLSDPSVPFIFPSQLDLSHTSASYCCLAASSRRPAQGSTRSLWAPVIITSAENKSTPWICMSSVLHCCKVRLDLKACICPDTVSNIDAPGSSTGYFECTCHDHLSTNDPYRYLTAMPPSLRRSTCDSYSHPVRVHPWPFRAAGAHCAKNNIIICVKYISEGKELHLRWSHRLCSLHSSSASVEDQLQLSLTVCVGSDGGGKKWKHLLVLSCSFWRKKNSRWCSSSHPGGSWPQ